MSERATASVVVRIGDPECIALKEILFKRYPEHEWATFARFGWRDTPGGIVLTLVSLDPPLRGELNERFGHVVINEPYSLRMALEAERHCFAVGVVHSHPRNYRPDPSHIDDDMDRYYSSYFSGFAPSRPYISLIFSELNGELAASGRVWWRSRWLTVGGFCIEQSPILSWAHGKPIAGKRVDSSRRVRLSAAFGQQASERLSRSTVAVIGAGGTGSAAIEALARAGVGRLVVVDPDTVEPSNLERLHGGWPSHADHGASKVQVAREHVRRIDPEIEVVPIIGRLPQKEVVDAVLGAHVALGCTDQQHSRLALGELAVRYLLPSIDCGVLLEGGAGRVTGQILQLVRFLSTDPCALCRRMTDARRLSQELMSAEERATRHAAAQDAVKRGDPPDPYWATEAQLNTVGYLTTIAGAMAAGYAIGWITGRFEPPFKRLQANLMAKFLDVTDLEEAPSSECSCRRVRAWADQGAEHAQITAPTHWPAPRRI
jgi:tRNA A37 threonylcarbamoyladenosine dehydratase